MPTKKRKASGKNTSAAEKRKEEARILKLKVERIRSDNQLIKQMDEIQGRLNKLGNYNRPYDDLLSDVKQRYYKQKYVTDLITSSTDRQEKFPFTAYTMIGAAVLLFTASFYILFSDPTITGAAVTSVSKVAANQFVSTAVGMFIVILVLGFALHTAEYRHKHMHDKYKPPELLK
ncbi:MAG: hypothetical protein V1729_07275 [Candidatus Woesearchaeota archaeon]